MSSADARRQRLLVGLLGILVLYAVFRFAGGLLPGGGGDGLLGGSRSYDFSRALATDVEALALDRLAAGSLEVEIGRNPWRYGEPPRIERPTPPPPQPVVRRPPPEPDPVPVNTEPPKPVPPPVDIRFLGSFGPEDRRIAVFESGDSVINAQVGEVIDGKFRVHAIGLESVDLTFEGFPDTAPERLPLSKR